MGKRASTPGPVKVVNKKPKTETPVATVVDVLNSAEDLPKNVRDMLVEMLPLSLGHAADTRHAVQDMAVNMMEKILLNRKASLQSHVDAASEKLATEKASEEELVKRVKELESELETQKTAVAALETSLTQVSSTAQASANILEKTSADYKAAEDRFMEAKSAKVGLEGALQDHSQAEVGLSWDQLAPFVKKLEIEASLLTALPSTCGKPKEQRKSFDLLVLEELERAFSAKITELSAAVEKDSPAVAELEAAMSAAEKEHQTNKDRQKQVETELSAAQKIKSDREAELTNAKLGVDKSKPTLQALHAEHDNAKKALSTFEDGPLTYFSSCKTKTTETTEVEAPVAPPC
jgi:DNA repair exonuclease SbcCD ATPase subunit